MALPLGNSVTKFYFKIKLSQKLKFVLKKISITQIHSIQSQLILEPSSQQHMENRELIFAQTISASIDKVWQAWANANQIAQWWGPNGFTNTIYLMDFKEEGEWKFTMHSPDGTNFPNRSIFKEIVPHHKIVYEHFNPHFIATVLFEARGEETWMEWKMLFDSAEMYEVIVKAHKADEGLKQNFEKLEKFLTQA